MDGNSASERLLNLIIQVFQKTSQLDTHHIPELFIT